LTQDELVQALRSQIKDLEATAASYDEQIKQLKESHSSATSALTESTSIQHESLLKAQADFDTISEELKALRLAHANVNKELGNKVTELKEKTEAVESLHTQLTSIKAEREEYVHRISELEVDVLELKELQEGLEDTRDSFQKRITALEQDLANAASAAKCAAEAAHKKETDHGEELNTQAEKHQMELEVEAARFANIASTLEKLNAEYAEAVAAHEKTKEQIVDKEKQHTASLEEREKSHADAIATLSSQLENVAHELSVSNRSLVFKILLIHCSGPSVHLRFES
jgi:chromosome segregation ATPase